MDSQASSDRMNSLPAFLRSKDSMAYFALLLLVLGFMFSYPLFSMEWVWDDHTLIKGNPLVHDFELQDLPQIFSSRYFTVARANLDPKSRAPMAITGLLLLRLMQCSTRQERVDPGYFIWL
jgi:hypothetical protein